jgi:hypothetical protein
MRYLKPYKLFESKHLDEIGSRDDEIRELLGNLVDDGLSVDIRYPHDPNLSTGYDLKVSVGAGSMTYKWVDIESEILRMIEFIKNKYLVLYIIGYGDGKCDDEVLPAYAGFFNNTRFFSISDFSKACGSRDLIHVEIQLRPKSNLVKENAFTEIQNIMDDINDICDDARDDGFVVEVKPDNEIHMKIIGLYRKASIESRKTAEPISVTFTKDEFSVSEIKDVIDRLAGYMRSENFDCQVQYISLLAARAGSVSMRKPLSKKISYEEFKSYLTNPDDFTFSDEYIRKLKEIKLIFDVDPLHILDIINTRK